MEATHSSKMLKLTYDPRRVSFDQHLPLCMKTYVCVAMASCKSSDDSGLLGYDYAVLLSEWFSF